jgi:hypothetical protein
MDLTPFCRRVVHGTIQRGDRLHPCDLDRPPSLVDSMPLQHHPPEAHHEQSLEDKQADEEQQGHHQGVQQ